MALTRDYKETILTELRQDSEFRKATYAEAVSALQENEVTFMDFKGRAFLYS